MLEKKLAEFFLKYDPTHCTDVEVSERLIRKLLEKGRIIASFDYNNDVLGFVESWRIDYETLGKYLCTRVYPDLDTVDVQNGNICYLANTVIHPDHRNTEIYKYLKTEFFKQNYMCEFFIGQAYRKKHQPLKIFTRQEFYDKYAAVKKEGVVAHG